MAATIGQTLVDDDSATSSSEVQEYGPVLFVLLEGDRPTASSSRHSLEGTSSVFLGRGPRREAERPRDVRDGQLFLRVPDARMSSKHAVIARVHERWFLEDSRSRNGTRIDGQAIQQHELRDGDLIELGRTVFLFRSEFPLHGPADVDCLDFGPDAPLTLNPDLARAWHELETIAPSKDIAILIEGESGSGKEVLARQIATWSRVPGAFVGVNCGALPATLVESELFGSLKGAFSGADANRTGLVRSADKGCLFLDEVADLPLPSQAALLRVLQEREVTPVGATRPYPVDLRIISATHQNLELAVERGQFRHDLYARIAGFRTRLPALRERKEDLGILIGKLLSRNVALPESVTLAPDAIRRLWHHDWPLNVRELSNTLTTAALLAGSEPIQQQHLPLTVPTSLSTPPRSLDEQQQKHRDEIAQLLRKHSGNVSAVAREVGKARTQVQRWMKRYDLKQEDYR